MRRRVIVFLGTESEYRGLWHKQFTNDQIIAEVVQI